MIIVCAVRRNNTISNTIRNKLTVNATASVSVGLIVYVDLTARAVKIISQLDADAQKAVNVVMSVLVGPIVDVVLSFYLMINVYVKRDVFVVKTANAPQDAAAVLKIKSQFVRNKAIKTISLKQDFVNVGQNVDVDQNADVALNAGVVR